MGKTFVVSGGNSGIGLEAARQLVGLGHSVVLLGRDAAKGQAALASLAQGPGTAAFHAVDLSTHAGVRAAADKVRSASSTIDGLILGAGVLTLKDMRTSDGLHPVFAVNYLSRYHLTQLLLPQLRAAAKASVVILVAGVPLSSRVDFSVFPRFAPWPGPRSLNAIQIANHHYVAHLAKAEPTLQAAVVNVGLVKTDIMRMMPLLLRAAFTALSPVVTIPVERSASNAVWLSTHGGWSSGQYWPKPGDPGRSQALALDPQVTAKVVSVSRELTGS